MTLKKFIRLPELRLITGVSTSTIYSWNSQPDSDFPKPVRLGPKAVGWRSEDVQKWMESREESK